MNWENKKLDYEDINFKWKYSDEKTLFKIKENLLFFIFSKLFIIIPLMLFIGIIAWIFYYFINIIASILIPIIGLILIFIYYYLIFIDCFLIFTTRRIIKEIRTGIFAKHRKELKIVDIKSSLTNKNGIIQTVLRIWNIKIEWTENDWAIYFTGIKEYLQISNYIWRVIDYVKLNWHTDNIAMYQNKKIRKEKKIIK